MICWRCAKNGITDGAAHNAVCPGPSAEAACRMLLLMFGEATAANDMESLLGTVMEDPSTLTGCVDIARAAIAPPDAEVEAELPAVVAGDARATAPAPGAAPQGECDNCYGNGPYWRWKGRGYCWKCEDRAPTQRGAVDTEVFDPAGPRCQEWSTQGRGQCVLNDNHQRQHDYNAAPTPGTTKEQP